jgi:hypothetical protein
MWNHNLLIAGFFFWFGEGVPLGTGVAVVLLVPRACGVVFTQFLVTVVEDARTLVVSSRRLRHLARHAFHTLDDSAARAARSRRNCW